MKIFYFGMGIATMLYCYYFMMTLLVDMALGPPFIAFGYFVVPYFVNTLAAYDVLGAEKVAGVLFFQFCFIEMLTAFLSHRWMLLFFIKKFALAFSVYYVLSSYWQVYTTHINSFDWLHCFVGFIVYSVWLWGFTKFAHLASYILPIQLSTLLYLQTRIHLGHPGLESIPERVVYEIPFWLVQYARFYSQKTSSGLLAGGG